MKFETTTVRDVMSTELITIEHNKSMDDVREVFESVYYRHLPVTENGKLVGIISRTDFDNIMKGAWIASTESKSIGKVLSNTPVEKVMTRFPFTVPPDTLIDEVQDIFKKDLFHAIPVLEGGELVGIVSQHDVFYYVS